MEIYLHRHGEQLGPLSETEFMQMVADGNIQAEDLIWDEAEQQWKNTEVHLGRKGRQCVVSRGKKEISPYWVLVFVGLVSVMILVAFWFKEICWLIVAVGWLIYQYVARFTLACVSVLRPIPF